MSVAGLRMVRLWEEDRGIEGRGPSFPSQSVVNMGIIFQIPFVRGKRQKRTHSMNRLRTIFRVKRIPDLSLPLRIGHAAKGGRDDRPADL